MLRARQRWPGTRAETHWPIASALRRRGRDLDHIGQLTLRCSCSSCRPTTTATVLRRALRRAETRADALTAGCPHARDATARAGVLVPLMGSCCRSCSSLVVLGRGLVLSLMGSCCRSCARAGVPGRGLVLVTTCRPATAHPLRQILSTPHHPRQWSRPNGPGRLVQASAEKVRRANDHPG